jgi:hypothetical protein
MNGFSVTVEGEVFSHKTAATGGAGDSMDEIFAQNGLPAAAAPDEETGEEKE